MRVAIVGSRGYPDPIKVVEYVRALPAGTIVISGGAPGPDTWAEETATFHGLGVTIYHADWDTWGRNAGKLRNNLIVGAADRLVAFWDGKSPGTKDSIDKARACGIPVLVVEP